MSGNPNLARVPSREKTFFFLRTSVIGYIKTTGFSHTIDTLTMFTLLPEKISTPDPTKPTDPQAPEPPGSTSAQSTPITSWSVIDVDPVARARWINDMMIFGHPDYTLDELCGDLLPL